MDFIWVVLLVLDIDEPVDSPPESSGSSEPPVAESSEPSRKRMKKETVEMDSEIKDDGSEDQDGRAMDPNNPMMDDQKHQLAALLSVWAQQTPLNPSVKQTSAGPSILHNFLKINNSFRA